MEMELDIGFLGDSEGNEDIKESIEFGVKKSSKLNIIPEGEVVLGLDISEDSSGISVFKNGERIMYNSSLSVSEHEDFKEVKLRRELKDDLREVCKGLDFTTIIIEDAFQGVNPKTTRTLYAINTAIDELIVDGEVSCKHFIRVDNGTWKSWLFSVDTEGKYKGLSDKLRIEKCLEMLGVVEEHTEGYQDRLDSTGMILGYFLCRDKADKTLKMRKKRKVSFDDIDFDYQEDLDFFKEDFFGVGDRLMIDELHWSKEKMVAYLTEYPECAIVTNSEVLLGNLATRLNLPYLSDGGYFGFWIKPRRRKKYLE